MKNVSEYISQLNTAWDEVDRISLSASVEIVQAKLRDGKTIFVVGNGGSSSTASHFVTDWVKGNRVPSGEYGKAYCLSDNVPLITAIANDLDFSEVFSYPLQSYGNEGDLLVCVTGSGNSKNIIRVCEEARVLGLKIVALTGFDGGATMRMADYNFHCPINDMQIVEDMHLSFGHMVVRCQG